MHAQTCSRTRIIAESAKKARIRHLVPDMHWESWTIRPAEPAGQTRPGVLQVADMQRGTGVVPQ